MFNMNMVIDVHVKIREKKISESIPDYMSFFSYPVHKW